MRRCDLHFIETLELFYFFFIIFRYCYEEVRPPHISYHMYILDNYYHIYNRGAHKNKIFSDGLDYEHFAQLLFVANDKRPLTTGWYKRDVWNKSTQRIVSIKSYCLMPNHFHLCVREIEPGGIEKFMHRLCTAYAIYYNKKYRHSGTIFQGNYKYLHVDSDEYLRCLIQYIHLNPYGIEDPTLMKSAKLEYLNDAVEYSRNYIYSSFMDYLGVKRPQNVILDILQF